MDEMWYTVETDQADVFREKRGYLVMTGELIKEVKHIQQCLVNKDMEGEEWEEKMEMVHKLEDVVTYLKDAMGRGIEF